MKEYSNAFKENYRYDKFIEVFNTGIVYYGAHEREFIKTVRDKYGLNIVTSDFTTYHQHFSVRAYFDFDSANDLGKRLRDEIAGQPLNDERYTLETRQLGDLLANEYLQILHYDRKNFSEIYLYAYDFKESVLARASSLSLQKIRSYFFDKYRNMNFWRILIWYEPSVTCILEDEREYKKLLKAKENIIDSCFDIVKQYDKFSILSREDINLKILLKSNLSAEDVNLYAREIF